MSEDTQIPTYEIVFPDSIDYSSQLAYIDNKLNTILNDNQTSMTQFEKEAQFLNNRLELLNTILLFEISLMVGIGVILILSRLFKRFL